MLHDVVHHQEIVGELLLADDGQFVFQPVAGDRRDGAVAPLRSGVGQGAQPLEGVVGFGKAGCHDPLTDRQPVLAPLRDLLGRVERLGAVGKEAGEVGAEPGAGVRI